VTNNNNVNGKHHLLKAPLFLSIAYLTVFFILSLVPFGVQGIKLPLKIFYYPLLTLIMITIAFSSYRYTLPRIDNFDRWVIFLCAGIGLSLTSSIDKLHSFKVFAGFIIKGPLAAFAAYRIFRDHNTATTTIYTTVKYITLCAGIVAVIGLVEYFFNWNPYGNALYTTRNVNFSTIGNPIITGAYLNLIFPLALALARNNNKKSGQSPFLYMLLAALISIAALLTLSRSSWIALLVSSITYLIISHFPEDLSPHYDSIKNIKKLLLPFILLLLTIISTAIAIKFSAKTTKEYFEKKFNTQMFHSSSFEHREKSYITTINILMDYPLLGVGPGNYEKVHKKYLAQGAHLETPTPDNMYLRFLCDTGIIGAAVFMVFLIYHIRHLYLKRAYHPLIPPILAGIIGFLIIQFVADLMLWTATQFTFWTLLGIGEGLINYKESKPSIA